VADQGVDLEVGEEAVVDEVVEQKHQDQGRGVADKFDVDAAEQPRREPGRDSHHPEDDAERQGEEHSPRRSTGSS